MFFYSLLFIIPIIIVLTDKKTICLKRDKFDETLQAMNKKCSEKIIGAVIAIVFALVPIIDNLLGPVPVSGYTHFTESRILRCDYSDGGPLFCLICAWMCFIMGVIIIIVNYLSKRSNHDKLNKLISEEETKQAKITAKKETEKQEDERFLSELSAKLGRPVKIVFPLNNRMQNAFIVFPQTRSIYVASQVIPFDQLVSCEIKDDTYTTVTGTKEEVTRSSNGSTVGRAIVGSMIAGPAGAIIGGVTSKKKTEIIDNTKTITHHHYFAILYLTSAANPIVTVDCGKYTAKMAEEIKAIVTGIVSKRVSANSSLSVADEITKLAMLKEQGVLTQIEFDQQKQKLLAGGSEPVSAEAVSEIPVIEDINGPIVMENEENSEVVDLIDKGEYLKAIKEYQNDSGCDRAEAMKYVNDLSKRMGY